MYKYRINHLLSCLPVQTSIEKFRANLMNRYNISPEVFHADRFIKHREHSSIPLSRLKIYAQEFNITLDELFSNQENTRS